MRICVWALRKLFMNCGSKKPNLSYFYIFGSTCYILKDREYLSKFDSKSVFFLVIYEL